MTSQSRPSENRFLTIAETSRLLRISPRTCYGLAERGQMPSVKVGGQYRVPVDALEDWLASSMRGKRYGH